MVVFIVWVVCGEVCVMCLGCIVWKDEEIRKVVVIGIDVMMVVVLDEWFVGQFVVCIGNGGGKLCVVMLVGCLVEFFVMMEKYEYWNIVQVKVLVQLRVCIDVCVQLVQFKFMYGGWLCEYGFFGYFVVEVIDVLEEYVYECIVCCCNGCVEGFGVYFVYVKCCECGFVDWDCVVGVL